MTEEIIKCVWCGEDASKPPKIRDYGGFIHSHPPTPTVEEIQSMHADTGGDAGIKPAVKINEERSPTVIDEMLQVLRDRFGDIKVDEWESF